MSNAMTAARLKKLLTNATKEQLIDDIVTLYTKFEVVQTYFDLRAQPQNEAQTLADYKAKVTRAMLPRSDYGDPKLSEARRVVNEFRKAAVSPISIVDLMLHYVECGIQFLNKIGDYKESFYTSLESMFEAALKLVQQYALQAEVDNRCRKMIRNAHDFGYGFGDQLESLYSQYIEGRADD